MNPSNNIDDNVHNDAPLIVHINETPPLEEDSKSKQVYLASNQDKRLLIVLCIAEVKQRGELFEVQPQPKPGQWNLEKLTTWLMDHPIQNPPCILFLSSEAARVNAIFEEALRVKRSEKSGPVGVWTKNEPCQAVGCACWVHDGNVKETTIHTGHGL